MKLGEMMERTIDLLHYRCVERRLVCPVCKEVPILEDGILKCEFECGGRYEKLAELEAR